MKRERQVKPSFINQERDAIMRALKWTVLDLKSYIQADPEEHTEHGCDEPSIDVRLCIDSDGWILRTGSSDYDPYHSAICAGSCVTLETNVDDLLEELINDALDQCTCLREEPKP